MTIDWPRTWANVWAVAKPAIDVISTIVIAWFAKRQWDITHASEQLRQRERQQDLATQRENARAALHAEWFRAYTVARNWESGELVNWALGGALRPEEILPHDWGAVAPGLGLLGPATAYLASYAFAVSHDAARVATALNEAVALLRESTSDQFKRNERIRGSMPALKELEATLKATAVEAANLLQDALDHVPGALEGRAIQLNDTMHSKGGRGMLEGLKTLPQSLSKP